MIRVAVTFSGNWARMDFPCHPLDIYDNLGSIGVRVPAIDIPSAGTEEIKVTLEEIDSTGKRLMKIIKPADSLGMINRACNAINCLDFRHEISVNEGLDESKLLTLDDVLEKIDKLKSKGITPKKADFLTRNRQFVAKHKYEFMIDRWYVDTKKGCITSVCYNPYCKSGGQLIYSQNSLETLEEAFLQFGENERIFAYLDANAYQTIVNINTKEFFKMAKAFIDEPYDYEAKNNVTLTCLKSLIERKR